MNPKLPGMSFRVADVPQEASQDAYVVTREDVTDKTTDVVRTYYRLTHWVYNGPTIMVRTNKTYGKLPDALEEIPFHLKKIEPCKRERGIVIGTWC